LASHQPQSNASGPLPKPGFIAKSVEGSDK
jgi:hypothetical protein